MIVRIPAGADGEWIRIYDVDRGVTIGFEPADPENPPRSRVTCFGG